MKKTIASISRAKLALQRLRKKIKTYPSSFNGMTEQQVINKLRETREKLWNEKLATLSARH